jgi:hypothetical protein
VTKGTREVGNHGDAQPMKTKQLVTTLSSQTKPKTKMNVFKIALHNGQYEVSIPYYPGGDVVPYETAKALADELAAERAKVRILSDALSNFIHGQIGDMICICGNMYEDECAATTAEKALNETKPNEPIRIK